MSTDLYAAEVFANPLVRESASAPEFGRETRDPLHAHERLPGYRRTPLLDLPEVAAQLGVASLRVKDESSRMGLPSFKILGASWAVLTAVADRWLGREAMALSTAELAGRLADGGPRRRLAAATDGNHGRGVARMARLLGLDSIVLVPQGTAAARIDGIAEEGAQVRVVHGTYDDAIVASAALADERTLVISDTSWPGYEDVPRAVIAGYSTMFFEIDDALADEGEPGPTVVVIQAGVGAFAAAALRHYRGTPGGPRTVVVEPDSANCLMASARAGGLAEVPGPHPSAMAGLNCGLPSVIAWPVVAAGTDTFVAIGDGYAYDAMRMLARAGAVAGESGAASLGGLLALAAQPAQARAAGLGPQARVLLVNTEGATDPVNYAAVVSGEAAPTGVAR